MSDKGYFKIARSLLEHEIWLEKPFGKGQAWIDLIGRANFKPTERLVGCDLITINRGQLVTSIGALAERWGWSRSKVLRYIKTLEDAKMITTKRNKYGTFITIEKYGVYQLSRNTSETEDRTQTERRANADRTQSGYTRIKDKKDKEGEEYARTRATPDDGWVVVYDPEEER